MIKRNVVLRPERNLRLMVIYILMISPLNFMIYALANITGFSVLHKIDSLYLYLFLYAWLLLVIPYNFRKLKGSIVFYAVFLVVCILLSSLKKDNIWGLTYRSYMLWILGTSIPAFYIMVYSHGFDSINSILSKVMPLASIILSVLYLVSLPFVENQYDPEHYMFFSSGASVLASIALLLFLEKKRKIDLICFIFLFLLILTGGARGGLLQIVATVIVYLLVKRKYKQILFFALGVGGIYFLVLNLSDWLMTFDVINTSRTMRILFDGGLAQSSDRNIIYERTMAYFENQSVFERLFGLGVGGERKFIAQNIIDAGYVHQIFLELILHFGYVGGSFAIIGLVILSIIGLRFISDNSEYRLVGTIIFASNATLLVSGSYASSVGFHLWIGFCIKAITLNRVIAKERNVHEKVRNKRRI